MDDAKTAQQTPRILSHYRRMQIIRKFELAAAQARTRGELSGPVHMSIGQEAVPVGVCANLDAADLITSTHRGHGHVLAKGADPVAMMCELYGRKNGCCEGKGGSMHIADVAAGVFGANGVVAAGINIAVGAAHAARLTKNHRVVACFIGDGAVNRGPFLEGLNWARIYDLPILFVCEDNRFAAATRTGEVTAGPGIVARAESLGLSAGEVDGNDVVAVDHAAGAAIAQIRASPAPFLLHAKTYRLEGHTVGDVRVYRPQAEVEHRWTLEPLMQCADFLLQSGVARIEIDRIEADAEAEIKRAVEVAMASPWPEPVDAFSDVQDAGAPSWHE